MHAKYKKWKQPLILLLSTGVAGIGDFIYLVAVNILIYKATGSAAAVAFMWMIGPLVNILTKFWTGGFIDTRSKRKIMIVTYLFRGLLIFAMAWTTNIWLLFSILICLSVAKSFFGPASLTYITMLVPKEMRKKYNSYQSMTTSGAFIVGPAVGGALIFISNIQLTLLVNATLFMIAAVLLSRLPNLDREQAASKLSMDQVKADWHTATRFMRNNAFVAFLYALFLASAIFSFAADAQEVVFTQKVVGLSEMDYSLLVSIAGIGAVSGAFLLSVISGKMTLYQMIALGILMEAAGYLFYAFSWSFYSVAFGFVLIGFFNAFLNTGMLTFYQNNVPAEVMGRVTSMFQLLQSIFQVLCVMLVGVIGDVIPLRDVIIALAFAMLVVALFIVTNALQPSKRMYFLEEKDVTRVSQ